MDQSASVAGGTIRFNGSTLEAQPLSPDLGPHAFVVIDSGVKRSLVSSSYPIRVAECRAALQLFRRLTGRDLAHLSALTAADLELAVFADTPDANAVFVKRARHVVSEVSRVNAGQSALERADWHAFGRFMTESGRSSAIDYEISHPIVEKLVSRLLEAPQVLGARMMGGGEGGSIIALVRAGDVQQTLDVVRDVVNDDLDPGSPPREVYQFRFSPGAMLWKIG